MKFHWQVLVALGLGAKRNWHIFFALIAGVVLGVILQHLIPMDSIPEGVEPKDFHPVYSILYIIGELFIKLIKMIVIPLVLSSLIIGIASLGDGRQLGRLGAKVLFFFILTTSIAAISGSAIALWVDPGSRVFEEIQGISDSASLQAIQVAWETSHTDIKQLFLDMVPSNPFASLANANLVPIIIFSIIFGAALTFIGETNRPIISFFESLFAATMKLTDWVMVLAVPGIFSLTALTIAQTGVDVFEKLLPYMFCIMAGLIIQLLLVYPLLLHFLAKVNFMSLYKAIIEAMMVAFGTASSNATLPVTIACCERRAGISNRISSFVLPLGTTMNMDGTAIFETVGVIFLYQAYGFDISDPVRLLLLVVMATVASLAAAGVPSAGLITMALVLNTIGGLDPTQIVPAMALIWSVDRFLDMSRTLVNVTSDCVVATIIAASEGELDYDLLNNQDVWKDVV